MKQNPSENNPNISDELKSLVDAVCDNTITNEQAERLESILKSDEAALNFYVQSMWLEEGIARHSSGTATKIDSSNFPYIHKSNLDSALTNPIDQTGESQMSATTSSQQAWGDMASRTGKRNWPAILATHCCDRADDRTGLFPFRASCQRRCDW